MFPSLVAAVSNTTLRWDALPPLWVIVLVIVPIIVFSVRAIYQREPGAQGRPLRIALGGLRILAILLVLAALFSPYAETVEGEVAKRTLVVAFDTSASMGLKDQYQRNAKLAESLSELTGVPTRQIAEQSRLQLAQGVVGADAAYLSELLETFDVQVYSFDADLRADFLPVDNELPGTAAERLETSLAALEPKGGVTRLGGAIQKLVRNLEARNEPVAGIFLFTDGRHTGGAPEPIEAAQAAADRGREGIPIFPVPMGDPSAAINVGVSRIDAPEVVLSGDRVTFTATVYARGCGGRTAQLEARVLDAEGRVVDTLPIDAAPFTLPEDDAEPVKATFQYSFPDKGSFDLSIGVNPIPGEAIVSDNFRRHTLRVVELKMNVLFVVGRPSFTYRFLNEALLRAEKTIRAQSLLLSAEPAWTMMSTRGLPPLRHFPRTRAELARFDVVILQDIDFSDPRMSTDEGGPAATLELLADWVKEGGGLVLQSGRELNFVSLHRDTALPALLPIVPGEWTQDDRDRQQGSSRSEKWLKLTDSGKQHPIMRVLNDPAAVSNFWESGNFKAFFYAYTPVPHAKSSANVLAVRRPMPGDSDIAEPHPIVALQDFGLGKVLWLGHEEFWRMRDNYLDDDPNLYYWRFWSGVIRHLATYRLLGGNKRIKIWVDRANGRYKVGDTVEVEAKFLDEDFNPVSHDGPGGTTRTIKLITPDGEEEELALTAVLTDPPEGLFRARTPARAPGIYRLSASLPDDSEPAKATFIVEETTLELRDPLVDMPTLTGVAQASRGRVLAPEQFRRIIEDQIVPPTTIVRSGEPIRVTLWDRAWVLWLFALLLGVEWTLRRINNML